MNERVKEKLELFVENRDIISKEFKFEFETMSIASALVFTDAGKKADVEKIKECRKILKEKTGALSSYRNTLELAITSKMSLAENPEKYIDDVMAFVKLIHKSKIIDSPNAIIAAMNVCDQGRNGEGEALAEKYNAIMKLMRKEHPLLTDSDDIPYVMMLALSDKGTDDIIREMEESYAYIRENFKVGKDSTQGLSEVLTLYDTPVKEKCDKAIDIFNLLKERGQKYGKDYSFASLGVLTNIKMDKNALADEIAEAAEFLHEHKGFGNWALGPEERRMFAAMVVAAVYGEDSANMTSTAITNSIAVAVAEEIAILMLMVSANTAIVINSH